MYNSLIVSISVKIWNIIVNRYQDSFIKRLVDLINQVKLYLSNGSRIVEGFKSDKDLISETLVYRISSNVIDFLSKVLSVMNNTIKKNGAYSLVYRNIKKLFKPEESALNTLFVFIISLGFGLIVNNLIRGFYSGKSYLVALILIVISSIGILCKDNYKEVVNNSLICKFVSSIFTIDDERGANWW